MATQTLPPPDRLAAVAPDSDGLSVDGPAVAVPPADAAQPAGAVQSYDDTQPNDAAYWLDADHPGLPITLDLRPLLGGKTLGEVDFDLLWAFIEANDLYAMQYRTGQICPDFVAEIRSATNTMAYLQRKMEQYIAAGVRLGWLIDPRHRRVTVYRPGQEPERLDNPSVLNGEDVMPGFEFRVGELIFDAAGPPP